jgi:hypothetical protein
VKRFPMAASTTSYVQSTTSVISRRHRMAPRQETCLHPKSDSISENIITALLRRRRGGKKKNKQTFPCCQKRRRRRR